MRENLGNWPRTSRDFVVCQMSARWLPTETFSLMEHAVQKYIRLLNAAKL